MAILKVMIAWTVGLVGVLLFCGSVSVAVSSGAELFYSLSGSEIMLPRTAVCVVWLAFFLYLAFFVALILLKLRKPVYLISLFVFGLLHTACAICIFVLSAYALGLLCLVLVAVLYLFLSYALLKKLTKFALVFLPYLVWLTYLFAVLYKILLLN